jgi:hypothetical protein
MRGARLLGVARRTRFCSGSGVGLVAIAARLVTGDGGALLWLVAAATLRSDAPTVRLVARHALGVALIGVRDLLGVARAAAGESELRAMWQPRVATLASLVPGERSDSSQLGGVTSGTGAPVRRLSHEIVRNVAALALDPSVKVALVCCVLVARATVAYARADL